MHMLVLLVHLMHHGLMLHLHLYLPYQSLMLCQQVLGRSIDGSGTASSRWSSGARWNSSVRGGRRRREDLQPRLRLMLLPPLSSRRRVTAHLPFHEKVHHVLPLRGVTLHVQGIREALVIVDESPAGVLK